VMILNSFDYPYLFHLEKYPSSIAPGFKWGISKGSLSHFECKAKAQSRSAAFTGINPSAIKPIQHVIALIISRPGCIQMNVLYAEILMGN